MTRTRHRPEESRRRILDAAEQLLIEGGPRAVQMRGVAQRVSMTDAGVAHHFGTRGKLLEALLRHGGRRVRDAVTRATQGWLDEGPSVYGLVRSIADVYAQGYGELAIALHGAGWRDKGAGMLEPVVDALHRLRPADAGPRPPRSQTRLAVAALHQALATESAYGPAFRRSAGIPKPEARDSRPQLAWWAATIQTVLGITER